MYIWFEYKLWTNATIVTTYNCKWQHLQFACHSWKYKDNEIRTFQWTFLPNFLIHDIWLNDVFLGPRQRAQLYLQNLKCMTKL